MRARPTVAVVITSYNYRAYLPEAIDSVLAQTHAPSEVLVVDDGSADGSPDLVRERYAHEPRVRLIVRPNGGQLASFVTGVRAANADVVAFLDADDVWEPQYLEAVADVFAARPTVDYVSTNLRYFGKRDGLYRDFHTDRDDGLAILSGSYLPSWRSSPTSAICIRRSLARRLMRVPPSLYPQWRTCADNCLAYGADVLGSHKYFVATPLARYRDHGGNSFLGRKRKGEEKLRHWATNEGMIEHYRRAAGLNPALRAYHLRHVLAEFRTHAAPLPRDLKIYRTLLWQSAQPWPKRLMQDLQMRLFYWTHRYRG